MLPLAPFTVSKPNNLDELKNLLALMDERTKIMAGGTDLLPNLKHGLYSVHKVISLQKVNELNIIQCDDNRLQLGSLVKLSEVAKHKKIAINFPALSMAASQIASPQIRNMGTVGGNICLDTRCLYFNQSEFWRSALGYCLKKDGDACHVVKTGKRCVAAASNDLATALLTYHAQISIVSPDHDISLSLDDFYTANGEKNNKLLFNQVVTSVSLEKKVGSYGGFFKLRHRKSIDFPLLSVSVSFSLDQDRLFLQGTLVVNALTAKPKVMDLAEFNGLPYKLSLVSNVASYAEKKCHPQTNICDDPSWRKQMISYSVKRAFFNALPCADL